MTDSEVLDAALGGILARAPGALVAALGADGFRVPMPESIDLASAQAIPMPPDRATMVDLVVPEDLMNVITIWEQAQDRGTAFGTVRTRSRPLSTVTLSIIDARHRHGVWFGIITDGAAGGPSLADDRLTGRSVAAPSRPRTATMSKNDHAIITAVDDRVCRMLGWSTEQLVGARSLDFIHPDDRPRAIENWMEMLSQRVGQRVRFRHCCQNGDWLWVEVENSYQCEDDDPDAVTVIARISDISDEMAAHEALARREQMFRRLAEALPSGLFHVEPDRSVVYANARLAQVLGVAPSTNLADQLASIAVADRQAVDAALDAVLDHGLDQELEVEIQLPATGERRRCAMNMVALADEQETAGAIVTVDDITETARMREELRIRATFDPLTGCHNRSSVVAILDQALAAASGGCGHDADGTAVFFMDLDGFKAINDEFGHATGDELLCHVADRLTGLLRKNDVVGRLGGDEFLLVARDVSQPHEALAIAERISDVLHHEAQLAVGVVELRTSVGVAISRPGSTSGTLIAQADTAMYESKRLATGTPVLFDEPRVSPAPGIPSARTRVDPDPQPARRPAASARARSRRQ